MLSFHTWLEPTSVLSLSNTHTSCENPWDNSLIAKAYTSLTCEPHQSLVHVPFTFSDKTRKLSAHQLQKKYHASDIFNLRLTVPALSTSVADITWSITLETVSQFFALCLLQFLSSENCTDHFFGPLYLSRFSLYDLITFWSSSTLN